jgi:5'-3' exonuclease
MDSSKKYILFDISNLLYRAFFANKQQDDQTTAGLAHHMALTTLNKYYKAFNPHKVIMTFDRSSWRKEYTASEECLSGKPYKGNRRQSMTPKEKEKFEAFLQHLQEFEELMRVHSSVVCLAGDGLEADDLLAGFCQTYIDDEIIIVSGDKDMIQLLRNPNVRLVDPATGKDRTLEEWDGDADLFMFEKCLRGDAGDNVGSAYPRIRKTKIIKAYNDSFERVNVMNDMWTDQTGKEHVVRHLFAENKLLMDLTAQPACIRRQMNEVINEEMSDPGSFSYFHFMGFLGKYEMKKISQSLDQYVPMLSR